jgi:hypothetical protein
MGDLLRSLKEGALSFDTNRVTLPLNALVHTCPAGSHRTGSAS